MREIRLSGSEGGGAEMNRLFLPLLTDAHPGTHPCTRSPEGNTNISTPLASAPNKEGPNPNSD
jgi:hypothetical protein